MSLFRGEQTHNHGLLAGVSAGAMGVLVLLVLLLLLWHRVSGPLGTALLVVIWALMITVVGLLVLLLVYAGSWVAYRVRNPAMLASRVTLRAKSTRGEVGAGPGPVPVLPSPVVAEVEAGGWRPAADDETAEAVLAALAAVRRRREE